jgi:hypothetical protein
MSDAEKKARLAEALRANLRKRKAQARNLAATPSPAEAGSQSETNQSEADWPKS